MFKSINLSRFSVPKKELLDLDQIKDQLFNGLLKVMEDSFKQRNASTDNSNFSQVDIDKIVKGYADKNMILAAASSLVPGPLGILGAIPELLLNFGNQMNMIYDLGCAYGKENFINKDLLLDIPIAAFGGNTNLVALQSNAEDLMDSPQSLLKDKAIQLGESIVQKTLKKSIVQFVPVAGPLLMGVWAKKTTYKISSASKSFLDVNAIYEEHFKPEENEDVAKEIQIQKIKGLANLIECNNEINEDQIAFIAPIIENCELADSEKKYLLEESMKNGSNFELNYELLQEYEEADDLIMDMVVLAKRSGHLDAQEKAYIYKEADALHLDKELVDDLLN